MLSPEDLVRNMYSYYKTFPNVSSIFVVDEDHFRWPDYLIQIRGPWQSYPQLCEAVDWFSFGSLDFIGAFVDRFGWDAIPEMGIGVMFIGVESKFGDLLKYKKRATVDPKWVFKNLHRMGVRTVGSWVCGWDFHSHANIMEDLNYFVALRPTYQQLTRLSPFPGTPLYDRLKNEGRLHDVPWENMHFWSETQKNLGLEDHETLNIVEQGYDLLYRTWGPSLLRRLDVELNGYEYAHVRGVYNTVFVDADFLGPTLYYGQGAGRRATASAVVGDIIELARNVQLGTGGRVPPRAFQEEAMGPARLKPIEEVVCQYYLRFTALDKPGVLSRISGVLGEYGISLESVVQKGRDAGQAVPLVFMTHEAREADIRQALGEIDTLGVTLGSPALVRIEG